MYTPKISFLFSIYEPPESSEVEGPEEDSEAMENSPMENCPMKNCPMENSILEEYTDGTFSETGQGQKGKPQ